MVNSTQIGVMSICCAIIVVICIGLFAGAWAVLGPMHYGLDKNNVGKTVDESTVYDGGRYMLGIGHTFLKFPRELIIIDFSSDLEEGGGALHAVTSDGQTVILEVTLYYRLIKEEVLDLYRLYALDYRRALISIAQAEIKNTAIKFSTVEYFGKRPEISNAMLNAVAGALRRVHVNVEMLLLRNIGLPSSLEESLIAKTVAQQKKSTALFDKEIAVINAKTDVIRAVAKGNVTQILGEAEATANLVLETGRAQGTQLVVEIEESAYDLLKKELDLSNEDLAQYLWATRKLRLAPAKDTLVVGFENTNNIIRLP